MTTKPKVPDHELTRQIGVGAYGEVWLARSVVGTWRAVKIVHRDSFDDERPYEREYHGIQRFEPVSRSDEGFVDILQIGRNDEEACFYYVMELADDAATGASLQSGSMASTEDYIPKTLQHLVREHGRLSCAETMRFVLPLTLALGHLHRQGLIHRDIKPSNIIFIGGIPKLADIGLVTEVSEARSMVGTEGYIPPEGPNSPQADIYSLGKVLYEMSMGKDRLDFPEPFTALGQESGAGELEELNAVILRACAPDVR
jgi:serine/threonine protein kinase